MNPPNLKRALSLDTFRGIVIFTMIFVNELAGTANIPYWMKHFPKNVDGMSFVDLVFPAFLFIVGMSIPFAIQARANKHESTFDMFKHIALRSFGLIIIGVFMVNAESGYDASAMVISIPWWNLLLYIAVLLIWSSYPKSLATMAMIPKLVGAGIFILLWIFYKSENGGGMTPQWWGILGLIGWAYFIASCVYLFAARNLSMIAQLTTLGSTIIIFLLIHFLINYGASSELSDGTVIKSLRENSGHLTHAAIVIGGLLLSQIFYSHNFRSTRLLSYTATLSLTTILAFLSWRFVPISKIMATPSWALFCVLFCSLIFGVIYWLVETKQAKAWCELFEPCATNPLFVYLIPFILGSLMNIFEFSIRPAVFNAGVSGIIWSFGFAIAIVYIGSLINKTGYRLKL